MPKQKKTFLNWYTLKTTNNRARVYFTWLSKYYANDQVLVQVSKEPEVVYPLSFDDTLYTLVMVDPDAPSRENPVRR